MPATLTFTLERLPSPIGTLLIAGNAAGELCALRWEEDEIALRQILARRYGAGAGFKPAASASAARQALEAYFDGDLHATQAVPTAATGTPFQRDVWAALREIPVGQTLSYGALAAKIGRPKAMRAVGLANGANPIGIVVPCHRVIGADASLTGFGGGLERKRWLLDHEGAAYQG